MFNAVLESPILSQLHRLCYKPRLPAIQRGACYPKGSDPLKKKHKDNQFAPENWGLPLPRFKRTNVPFQGPGHQSPRCSTAPLTCPPVPQQLPGRYKRMTIVGAINSCHLRRQEQVSLSFPFARTNSVRTRVLLVIVPRFSRPIRGASSLIISCFSVLLHILNPFPPAHCSRSLPAAGC